MISGKNSDMQPALIQSLYSRESSRNIQIFKKFQITEYSMIVNILRIYSKTMVL